MPKKRGELVWFLGPGRKSKSTRKGLQRWLSFPRILIALKKLFFLRYNSRIFLEKVLKYSIGGQEDTKAGEKKVI